MVGCCVVGNEVGLADGDAVGWAVGLADGLAVVGNVVGAADGCVVGREVGDPDGCVVGKPVGVAVGLLVQNSGQWPGHAGPKASEQLTSVGELQRRLSGTPRQRAVGAPVGSAVGCSVGRAEGAAVGAAVVGTAVGTAVGLGVANDRNAPALENSTCPPVVDTNDSTGLSFMPWTTARATSTGIVSRSNVTVIFVTSVSLVTLTSCACPATTVSVKAGSTSPNRLYIS